MRGCIFLQLRWFRTSANLRLKNTGGYMPTSASATPAAPVSKWRLWTGGVITALLVLFMLFNSILTLMKPEQVVKGTVELGYPESSILVIGMALLVSTILYAIPRTAVLGAILLTAYLGGAVASHVRHGDPLSRVLIPVFVALLIWGGLWLRDDRLRTLIPLRS